MTSTPDSVVIVGASLAGHATARALRRQGHHGRITLVGGELQRPYDRPPLTKQFLTGTIDATALALEDKDEQLDAEWLLGRAAVGLDAQTRTVRLADGARITGDAVVVATGARARTLPGQPASAHTLRTVDDAVALREQLRPGVRVVVVGAGFLGCEVAAAAVARGAHVTLVEQATAPLAAVLGPEIGALLACLHEANGVQLRCGTGVATIHDDHVDLADGTSLAADVVVVAAGSEPNTDWLAGSGLRIDDGVVCDAAGRTGVEGIWALGDVAAWWDPISGRHVRVEHWTDAWTRATPLARALLGHPGDPADLPAPYFWSDQHGSRLQFAGRLRGGRSPESIALEHGPGGGVLGVYTRDGDPVAVVAIDQPREFGRWRRRLAGTLAANASVEAGAGG